MVPCGRARWRRCGAFTHEGQAGGLFIGEVRRVLKQ
jgi:hypothetical protein